MCDPDLGTEALEHQTTMKNLTLQMYLLRVGLYMTEVEMLGSKFTDGQVLAFRLAAVTVDGESSGDRLFVVLTLSGH